MAHKYAIFSPSAPSPSASITAAQELQQPFDRPLRTLTSSPVGFIRLTERDVFFSENLAFTYQSMVVSANPLIITNVASNATWTTNTAPSPASSYAYLVQTILQNRQIAWEWPLWNNSSSGYLQYFRLSLLDGDIQNDRFLGMGNLGVISVKKIKYGEAIKPLSFTATTSAVDRYDATKTYGFKDSFSGDESFGILVDTTSGLSAGIIFYDTGLAVIHGPTSGHANSISALTSVAFYSTMKMWQYNIFCTVDPNQLNSTNNPNSFYNSTITDYDSITALP